MNVVFVTQGFPIVALVLLSIKIDAPVDLEQPTFTQ